MKAITIWQPWASLAAIGVKGYETRSWATNYRGPIAIHAAKKSPLAIMQSLPVKTQQEIFSTLYEHFNIQGGALEKLPTGAIIATAELVNCWHIVYNPGTDIDVAKHIPIGAESMTNDKHAPDFADYFVPTEREMLFGDWTPGRYAWEFRNVTLLDKPHYTSGKQGLWNFDTALLESQYADQPLFLPAT